MFYEFSPYILERQMSFGTNTIQYNRRWFYHKVLEPIETEFFINDDKIEWNSKFRDKIYYFLILL